MAKLQVMTLDNLTLYDGLIKGYVDVADAKSLKTVAIDGNTLKFYKVEEPVGETAPAYEITLPETDISGLIAKITGATVGNVVIANADGTVADGGIALADLATDAELKTVSDKVDAIENADTGILATAKTYTDAEVKELADGAVKTNTDAIAKLNGDATTEGSVAKAVKDSADAINTKIGTLTSLDTTAKTDLVSAINEVRQAVEVGGTGSQVTIDSSVAEEGMVKSYVFKQGETTIGTVNVPLDLVVSEGSIVTNPDAEHTGTYLKLVIANQDEPIYIDVKDLVDAYTAQASATQIQLAISNTNEISATIVAGSVGTTELADGSVNTVKIADANVTLAKLATDVTDSIADAKKAGTDAATAVTTLADGQVKTNTEAIAALQTTLGDGVEAISESAINALFA